MPRAELRVTEWLNTSVESLENHKPNKRYRAAVLETTCINEAQLTVTKHVCYECREVQDQRHKKNIEEINDKAQQLAEYCDRKL